MPGWVSDGTAGEGRAEPALGSAAFGSFIAGTLAVVGLMLMAPPLARYALKFGPPEYAGLMFLALTVLSYVASGSMLKAFMMYGVNPGPLLIQESPDIFWGTVTSIYTGNA